jgi:hypothetical protein
MKLIWIHKNFACLGDLLKFLNKLEQERQLEAKIVVHPSLGLPPGVPIFDLVYRERR